MLLTPVIILSALGTAGSLPVTPAPCTLDGLSSWSGVRSITVDGATLTPTRPLALALSAGGRVRSNIDGDPGGTVSLQQYRGRLHGVIRSPKHGVWVLRGISGGPVTATRIDASLLGGCDADLLDTPSDGDTPDGEGGPDADGPGGSGGVVDVFVAFTHLARQNAGSTPAMEAAIQSWVNDSNDIYASSASAMRIRLVGTGETNYNEVGSYQDHLTRLRLTADGNMDEVHDWRDDTGADLVVLIVADSASCGLGYTIKNDTTGFAHLGFSVVRDLCADIQFSFTHEIGHNMGCCHDADHPGSCAGGQSLYPYSFGHRFVGESGNWRSVMAYSDQASDPWTPLVAYTRVGHLSNPAVDFDGVSTGTPLADNAATHDAMLPVTAAYRPAVVPMTCLGDLDGSSSVAVGDILALLEAFGLPQGSTPHWYEADLNGDDVVDIADLLVLLSQYGPCNA